MEEIITLDYGSGGKKTSALIEEMILPLLDNEILKELDDGALLPGNEQLVFSTDSFVVSPYFFSGGDIGKLAVCGTVNDVAVSGGEPKYLSLSLILEEGLPVEDLRKIIASIKKTSEEAGVKIVTGDTKVVERGKGDGIYINTSGIGFLRKKMSKKDLREGDVLLVSGPVGNHGTAVMLGRNENLVFGDIRSDCAPLHEICRRLYELEDDLVFLRDPTRGGIATTLNEFVEGSELTVELEEKDIPVEASVSSACDILGIDPYYCACEGRVLVAVRKEAAEKALEILHSCRGAEGAAVIGTVTKRSPGRVLLKTGFGGSRILNKLSGAQLPRIC